MADPLATRLRTARTDAGLTRETIASILGVSLATVVRYETGRTNRISMDTVVQIANATGKPLSFFLEEAIA